MNYSFSSMEKVIDHNTYLTKLRMFDFQKVSHISYKPVLKIQHRLEHIALQEEIVFFHNYHECIFASPQIFLKNTIKTFF